MKLREELLQFENTPTLIVASGWQTAKFYFASDGEISFDRGIEIEGPDYSDKEGHFKKKGGNVPGTIRSGAVYEKDKEHIRKEFLKQFSNYLGEKVREEEIESIYIFSPPEGLKSLEESINSEIKKLIKGFLVGNYINKKPDELVEKMTEEKPKPIELMSEEAKKILDKTDDF